MNFPKEYAYSLLVLILCATKTAHAYFFDTGRCEKMPIMKWSFDTSKVSGKWYIVQGPVGLPACTTVDVTISNSTVFVDIQRPLPEIFEFGFPAALLYKMQAQIPQDNTSYWRMTMPKPINLFGTINVFIPATDYVTYAAVYICKEYYYGKLSVAMILSRNQTLSNETTTGILDNFKRNGIDMDNINVISQTECNVDSPSLFRERENILPWKLKHKGAIPDASVEMDAEVIKRTPEYHDAEHLFNNPREEPVSSQ